LEKFFPGDHLRWRWENNAQQNQKCTSKPKDVINTK